MIVSYYRGKTTFGELMKMHLTDINYLYKIAERQVKTKEGQEKHQAEQLEDELEANI